MSSRRNKDQFWGWMLFAGVALIGIGIALYFVQPEPEPPSVPAVVEEPPPPPPPSAAARPAPLPVATPTPRAIPLPPLDQSDGDVLGGLTELLGQEAVMQFLVPERLIRNIVVTIDNAPRQQMALSQRPVVPTPGEFLTSGPENAPVIAADNYTRYAPLIQVVRLIDAQTLVALYRGLAPLFQQAYEELGHPNGVFNSRLLEVIDHLLATPEPPAEIRLVQPSVLYRYADEDLEKRSAGQKLMLRMGPENAAVVKAKLREIRAALR